MKIVFLDAATLGDDLSLTPFNQLGEVEIYPTTSNDVIAERIENANVLVVNKQKLSADILFKAPNLKLICICATGFDIVDLAYCRANGIAVSNVAGYSTNNVTQLTISMVLYLINRLPEYNAWVQSGKYSESGVANKLSPVYHEIAGKTWGIVGYGNIGKSVCKVAEALGCKVLIYKKNPSNEVEITDFDTLCKESDILSFHVPLNDGTRNLLDEKHIAMLKKNAIVVNTARGAVTDEKAIAEAIKQEKIGAFATDVYSLEPFPKSHPFYEIMNYPNVLLTPHMAWGSYESRIRLMDEVKKNIEAFVNGERRFRVD